jgi:hypothetical protein
MTNPSWLPDALRYADFNGEWDRFLDTVYQIFERDFKKSKPVFQNYPVTHDSRIEDGKEAVFWHITCRDDSRTGDRELDIRRCERIPWPRPMIEHPTDTAISIWKNERKKTNTQRQTRILIWLEDLDYIVILSERPKTMVFVTAYCTDIASQKERLKKERDEYYKMQKPPDWAT